MYDVKTAYNNADKAVDFTVTAKADKDKWTVAGSTVQIPLDKLYTETQKFEVSYKHFENATYNAATETIYITGQSPIKDGTITVSKTTLDLATGSDSFLSADVAGKDAFNKAYKYKNYWRKNGKPNGGITVSGGEPLLQIDFVTEFFKLAKEKGVHTTLDSSGSAFTREEPFFSKFNELMKYTDLVMLDLKQTDTEKHKELTGRTNENILDMAKYLSDIGKDMWIRRVLVPNLTNDDNELNNLYSFISSLKTVKKVEILPYHTLGIFKWENLGIKYPLEGYKPPTKEEVEKAEKILHIEK